MPRYIGADKLQPDTSVFLSVYAEEPVKVYSQERIDNAPTEDVQPVKHGHWVNENFYTHCSACGNMAIYDKYGQEVESDYCPRCGAKMGGGDNE